MPAGSIAQRDEAGRREDAHLAHPATDELASPMRPGDDVARADDDAADRAAEALAQAERDRVGRTGQVVAVTPAARCATTAFQNRAPSTWSGTPRRAAMAAISRV
jgi:hypothetical protein